MTIMIPRTTTDSSSVNPLSCFLVRLIGNFLFDRKNRLRIALEPEKRAETALCAGYTLSAGLQSHRICNALICSATTGRRDWFRAVRKHPSLSSSRTVTNVWEKERGGDLNHCPTGSANVLQTKGIARIRELWQDRCLAFAGSSGSPCCAGSSSHYSTSWRCCGSTNREL
jgi:hypothetical protein